MKWLCSSLVLLALPVLGCTEPNRKAEGFENGRCYGNQTCNSPFVCNKDTNLCVRDSSSGGQGGTSDNGGSGGNSGSDETGGSDGSGGTHETGGAGGSGGTSETGGSSGGSGGGGSASQGGSSGAGGSTPPGTNACNATASENSVVFCKGQAIGAMTGWGWVALGSADTLTDPTCNTSKTAITSAASCAANTNWNKPDALCMTGSIPALPEKPTDDDYASNWGVQIGVNAKDPNAGIGSSWKTVTFTVTGSPTTGLRAIAHKNGDPDSTSYCIAMTPGTAIPITDFNSKCWDSSGTALTEADAASIDKLSVQVSSTAAATDVTDLCVTKIEFGK